MDRDCMDKKIEEALNDKDINNIMNPGKVFDLN